MLPNAHEVPEKKTYDVHASHFLGYICNCRLASTWLLQLISSLGYLARTLCLTSPPGHFSLSLTSQPVHSGWPIHAASLLCQATWPFCLALLYTPPGYSTWPYDLSTLLSHFSWPTWLATLTNIFILSVLPAYSSWATYQ
jgi:hypothetical protein